MEMYKRIASVTGDGDRADVTDELIDRYGELPPEAETLLDISLLRALCNSLGVSAVTRGAEGLILRLEDRYVPDPACFLQAISETDGRLVLSARGASRLVLKAPGLQEKELLQEGLKVMRPLAARVKELEAAKAAAEAEAAERSAE